MKTFRELLPGDIIYRNNEEYKVDTVLFTPKLMYIKYTHSVYLFTAFEDKIPIERINTNSVEYNFDYVLSTNTESDQFIRLNLKRKIREIESIIGAIDKLKQKLYKITLE